jgi:hypothetical protein
MNGSSNVCFWEQNGHDFFKLNVRFRPLVDIQLNFPPVANVDLAQIALSKRVYYFGDFMIW